MDTQSEVLQDENSQPGFKRLAYWVNPDKHRYYEVLLGKDLFGVMLLIRRWGSLKTKAHGEKATLILDNTKDKIASEIAKIAATRKKHGYHRLI